MDSQTNLPPIPAVLNHGMTKFTGHLILVPGRLYFICEKSKNVTGDLIANSLRGNTSGLMHETEGDLSSMGDMDEGAVNRLDELAQVSPDSFAVNAAEVQTIKRGFFATSMTVQSKKYALLYPGIAKEYRPALKAWCVAHNVAHKGLG